MPLPPVCVQVLGGTCPVGIMDGETSANDVMLAIAIVSQKLRLVSYA